MEQNKQGAIFYTVIFIVMAITQYFSAGMIAVILYFFGAILILPFAAIIEYITKHPLSSDDNVNLFLFIAYILSCIVTDCLGFLFIRDRRVLIAFAIIINLLTFFALMYRA